ncbi:acetyltransferase, GNAT family protein [Entamoeba histolytica HM-1:IMSS-B]|uniref:Acetyltransferase, GNAT family n=6 Tax=Entamoeba histolytica TaxID=5759 RepID=C4M0A1_ENTH1|nr:acetyltransferase, GNAT family [Entamoeba histolytica HM-1:IMSS]EMD46994.1 acetyltransferase GNAT family protein, putative [Entamoeba histolytica KU27]EMH72036.1 acetyltransferase, GNAT family protein [Entamoeba histolytica HM-1:IMSS-B]ENY62422.1 acetyltransferase, GNAT family protein, putative [Entamoeba histolytica HM-1:IMSS-A]GAT94577.1 acetyltransferase gnat family [Entamoeba histolytica]EAL47452.1 acetyltransferase, GNAT family [Entamoeba histolytica HM-1:IMSS]|eukprot:XP_652840.1 acetyltransferase, GNAT family [Entamoeba histolytica HM-1:IMSS]
MINIRRATPEDLPKLQGANLINLAENYTMKYYYYHLLLWPSITYLAECVDGKVVGYVLTKMDEDSTTPFGHITSISVLRSYRRLGIATKLLRAAENSMIECFGAEYVTLHVRESNKPARHLYEVTMGYKQHSVDKKYYNDGEDAIVMRHYLNVSNLSNPDASSDLLDVWKSKHLVSA